jgi:uncharacterized protein (DUF58 family)
MQKLSEFKPFKTFSNRRRSSPIRRLQLSVSGKWFVTLSIAIGVVALVTGNNTLYLIESLLLSGLILSGVLSERFISAVEFEVHRHPAIAKAPVKDKIRIKNHKRFTVFSIELGEWGENGFIPLAYIPRLSGRESMTVMSRQKFEQRGTHRWKALAVATSYPFGFAHKIRLIANQGERLVWPERETLSRSKKREANGKQGRRSGNDLADAEIRPFNEDDDIRSIVWTLSSKGTGPFVRVRRSEQPNPEVTLDLRLPVENSDAFEKRVRSSAQPFYGLADHISGGTLNLITRQGKKRIQGRNAALNELAIVDTSKKDAA